MKKIISLLISLLLIFSTTVIGFADTVANLTLSSSVTTVKRNGEIEFIVKLQNCENIKSLAFVLDYDTDNVFELQSGEWLLADSIIANVDKTTTKCGTAAIAFSSEKNPNGNIFKFKLKTKSNATIGSTQITVTPTIKNGTKTIECSSAVTSVSVVIPVSGITLDKSTVTVKTGNTVSLIPTVSPSNATNKAVTWSSSDNSVATVNNGVVTGVKKGAAVITAKTSDGSYTASCNVSVECSHINKTIIDAKESTCKEQGNDAYYKCDDCNQLFSSSGAVEVTSVPFRSYAAHKGGTATCKNLAVCSVCGKSYGSYGSHNYSAQTKTTQTLKTAGTCTSEAIYYYSCSVCVVCEKNASHTFKGSKNSSNHTGGTEIRNAVSATCGKNGYTGDTYCKGCGVKLSSGTIINATGKHSWNNGVVTTTATCKSTGVKTFTCSVCKGTKTETIAKVAHTYKSVTTSATLTKDGKIQNKCSVCGNVKSTTAIAKIKTVTLSKTSTTYTGKAIKPTVTVKDSKGKTVDSKYYTVTYKNNTNVGKATVTVKFKGNYSGTKTLTFTINPKATTVSKVASTKKGTATVTVKKQATQTTGYEIQYSTSSKFTASTTKTVKITSAKTLSKTISKLTSGKTYYFRVRTYKTVSKVDYTSAWSTSVKAKIK